MRSRTSPVTLVATLVATIIVAGVVALAFLGQLATTFHPSVKGPRLYRPTATVNKASSTYTVGASVNATPDTSDTLEGTPATLVSSDENTLRLEGTHAEDYIVAVADTSGQWVGGFTAKTGQYYFQPSATNEDGNIAVSTSGAPPTVTLYTSDGQKLWSKEVRMPYSATAVQQQGCSTVSIVPTFENSFIVSYTCPDTNSPFVAKISKEGTTRWARTLSFIPQPGTTTRNFPILSTAADGKTYMISSMTGNVVSFSQIDSLSGGDISTVPMSAPQPWTVTGFQISPNGDTAVIAGSAAGEGTSGWTWGKTKITDGFLIKTSVKEFAPWWVLADKKFAQTSLDVAPNGNVVTLTTVKKDGTLERAEGEIFNSFTGKNEYSNRSLTTIHGLPATTIRILPTGTDDSVTTEADSAYLFTSGDGTGRFFLTVQGMR